MNRRKIAFASSLLPLVAICGVALAADPPILTDKVTISPATGDVELIFEGPDASG